MTEIAAHDAPQGAVRSSRAPPPALDRALPWVVALAELFRLSDYLALGSQILATILLRACRSIWCWAMPAS
jgi:hypothetical protein